MLSCLLGEFVDRSVELDVLERAIYPGNRVRIHATLGYRLFGKIVRGNEEIDLALINPETREAVVVEVKWSNLDYIEA